MTVRVLSEHDVRRLLPVAECIEPMAEALAALARDELYNPLRSVVLPPDATAFMGLMPAYRATPDPVYSLKAVCIAPGNPALGLDSHQGFVALFDGVTGRAARVRQRLRDHRRPHRRRLGGRDAAARPARLAHARDPRRRRPGAVAPRRDARRAAVRARARLEPDAREGGGAGRRRGGRDRRGGARRRRRRRDRDDVARADRAAASGSPRART